MGLHLSSHMYKTNMYKKSFASIYKEIFFFSNKYYSELGESQREKENNNNNDNNSVCTPCTVTGRSREGM